MLLGQRRMRVPRGVGRHGAAGGALAAVLFLLVAFAIHDVRWPAGRRPSGINGRAAGGGPASVYLLPFEVASVLLLVALVGAILLASEEQSR